MNKAAEAFRTIGEVATELDVPKHVLRFWEGKFPHIRPMKRGGGRRYYRPEDMELLRGIRHLLHAEGYTIKGVQKILREQGIDEVKAAARAAIAAKAQAGKKRGRKDDTTAVSHLQKEQPSAQARTKPAASNPQPGQQGAHPGPLQGPGPAQGPGSGPGSGGAERRDVIAASIRELEACRQILLAGTALGAPVESEMRRAGQGRP